MGKILRQRQKNHTTASSNKQSQLIVSQGTSSTKNNSVFATATVNNKIFPGVPKPLENLKNDAQIGVARKNRIISKKNKHKLKRQMLVHKINSLNEVKKQIKERNKRKNNVIIGDTNCLHDALPSLDSLVQKKINVSKPVKFKSVAKLAKRKKAVVEDVSIFKKILLNKHYKKNPLNLISEHVKQRVQSGEL